MKKKLKILNYFYFEKKDKIKIIFKISLIFVFIIHFFFCIFQTIKNEKNYYERRIKNFRNYNETNLITFEDKINWLVIHDTNRLKAKCADKIKLHDYSKEKLGKDICNKILKIYKKAKEINFNKLPEQFVLKTNHGSGFNIIVEDKKKLDIEESIRTLNHWIKIDYGKIFEFHYSFIKRKIFAEEFIGNNLKNYKFLCYSGRPKYVYVSIKDNGTKYRNFYDMKWNFMNFSCLSEPHPTYKFNKPKYFELMKYYERNYHLILNLFELIYMN